MSDSGPPKQSWTTTQVLVVIGVAVAAGALGYSAGNDQADTQETTPVFENEEPAEDEDLTDATNSPRPTRPTVPQGFALGDTVEDRYLAYTVNSFTCDPETPSPNGEIFGSPGPPQGQWCVAQVTVENIGSAASDYAGNGGGYLYDEEGREYQPNIDAIYAANEAEQLFAESQMNPGQQATGTLWWDLPLDAEPSTLLLFGPENSPAFGLEGATARVDLAN